MIAAEDAKRITLNATVKATYERNIRAAFRYAEDHILDAANDGRGAVVFCLPPSVNKDIFDDIIPHLRVKGYTVIIYRGKSPKPEYMISW